MHDEIVQLFETAGVAGSLCVQDSSGRHEVGVAADELSVAGSVFKVLVAVEVERQIAAGLLDPSEPVRLTTESRTPGLVGFSLYADEIVVSVRDLVVSMLTISDNVATDALLGRVGIDACNATAASLGMSRTVIAADLQDTIASIAQSAGFADWEGLMVWSASRPSAEEDAAVTAKMRSAPALTAATATRTTPRDMCVLLREIWSDRAAPPEACQRIRDLMGQQLTRHRLAAGFARPARISAKSGGLVGIYRHEVGVIDYPDGRWYTAAVFTRSSGAGTDDRLVNATIGRVAARAVELCAEGARTAIAPDTKDWTWVLTRPCPECGFDARTFEIAQAASMLRDYAAQWQQIIAMPGAARRGEPDRWSPLEYACHVTDVCIIYLGRIDRMVTENDPLYQNWDQDATAIEHRYAEQQPQPVAEQLDVAAAALAARFETIRGDEWQRPGRRSDGASFTVESIARYFLHDLFHHLWDVGETS